MNLPLAFGLLVAVAVLLGFVAVWRIARSRDPVEARLAELGLGAQQPVSVEADDYVTPRRRAWSGMNRLLAGFGFGPRLAMTLTRADVPLTAAEFAMIMLGAGLLGGVVGAVRVNPLVGLGLGVLCAFLPLIYVRWRAGRRLRAFTEQLPDVLTLLVGALRAGYGVNQALEMLVDELSPPASTEFARVLRAIGLGLPVQRALSDMAERVGSDDLALVVTAIVVQYEMGGNLAQTLDTIAQTVRDRIYMLREIRVLTAQQRITGYILGGLPFLTAILMLLIQPGYIRELFQPGWIRLVPLVAVLLQVAGFLIIRRIVDIEV